MTYDRLILGAGLYGLYAALRCGARGERVAVLERDSSPFSRATYINQARVHQGYHYPRSLSTAIKSAGYFERFCADYDFCLLKDFTQVYATSTDFSWTDAGQFETFCRNAHIPCEAVPASRYFNPGMVDGAFETREYTYDAMALGKHLLSKLVRLPNVQLCMNTCPQRVEKTEDHWRITAGGETFEAPFVLNATYAGVNDIHKLAGFEPFGIKYELCEIILCEVNDRLKDVGITVMDGPFFSIMPFGQTGLHSLTSVTFTPHTTSYEANATFECQQRSQSLCYPGSLYNCNRCPAKPQSAWPYMSQLAKRYLKEEYGFTYVKSLFSMKPILKASEVDDSRPTVIRACSEKPGFYSVLSGKINTVYDLDPILDAPL